ncbi:MAG: deoxyribonuclease V [Desulfobacterales bacterium]
MNAATLKEREMLNTPTPVRESSPSDAIALQKRLAAKVIRKSTLKLPATVAGVDTGYSNGMARAAVVNLKYPSLEPAGHAVSSGRVDFPYIPGLLSLREGPVILEALAKLTPAPDLLIVDGHGIAHPRRFGLACHIGLLADIPSIGCAKTKLLGAYDELGPERGSFSYLIDQGEIIGAVLRTRSNVKPVFVSIGHKVNLKECIEFVLNCCRGYRLPETTRRADRLSADG